MSVTKINLTTQTKATGNISLLDAVTSTVKNRITNAADPIADQDLATKGYVDQIAQEGDAFASVVAAAVTNVTIATPGATVDNVALVNGDRVLLTNQTTTSENGIWVFNGAASAMTRPSDFTGTLTKGSIVYASVYVTKGAASGNSTWQQQSATGTATTPTVGDFIIGTDATTWIKIAQLDASALISAHYIPEEIPSGTVDGVNAVFTCANTPLLVASGNSTVQVFVNGQRQKLTTDYTISGAVITFVAGAIPVTTDVVQVAYFK